MIPLFPLAVTVALPLAAAAILPKPVAAIAAVPVAVAAFRGHYPPCSPLQAAVLLSRAYPISRREGLALVLVAGRLGANWAQLAVLIDFESAGTWSTSVVNPTSDALGLIQFIPRIRRYLGVTRAQVAGMTVSEQLVLVERYLQWTASGQHPDDPHAVPLDSLQRLAMTVFYPPARAWAPVAAMPSAVTAGNPSILTPWHYTKKLRERVPAILKPFAA